MIKISVIIPVYNDEAHIGRSVESVCAQTIASELEIIIVDDGSRDGSMAIAHDVLECHSMLQQAKLIPLENNHGVANARKVAIESATGEYVMFCDSDDWMEPQMCELMLSKAETDGCNMVVCDYNSVQGDMVDAIQPCYRDNYLQQLILCRVTGSLWNKLVRAAILKRFDFIYPDYDFSEDHAYSIQFAMFSDRIGYVPEPLYNYVKRPDSLVRSQESGRIWKRFDDDLANVDVELAALEKAGLIETYREEIVVRKLQTKNAYRQDATLWRNAFPELDGQIFRSKYIPFRSKCAYLLRMIQSVL